MNPLPLYQARIQTALLHQLPPIHEKPQKLHEAMHYAVFNGGKRLRPILVYATGETLGVDFSILDVPACAVEFIHAYSLVHDDLPAMDDDDWRRGKPACHKAFDEATAILAGDALQTLAFGCLTQLSHPSPDQKRFRGQALSDSQRLQMVHVLANACGSRGMAGGQAMDLAMAGQSPDLAEIERLCALKTGALINASVKLGMIAAGITQQTTIDALNHYSKSIGLAFQIQDDILDIEGEMATLGKEPGSDHKQNKPTYAAVMGLANAKAKVVLLKEEALVTLNSLGMATGRLQEVTDLILK